MTVRKLAVFMLPALWIALIVIRVFDGEEPKRMPLKFKSGTVAAADVLSGKGPAPFDVSEDGEPSMPLTPKNIFAPLGTAADATTVAAIAPMSRSGSMESRSRSGRRPASIEGTIVRALGDNGSEGEPGLETTSESDPTAESDLASEALPIPISLSREFLGPPEPSLDDLLMRVRQKVSAEVEEARRQQERVELEAKRQEEFAASQIRQQRDREAQEAKQKRDAALQQARQLIAQYRFLGYLEEGDHHQAFLAKGQQLFVVQRGQMVEGRVRIKAVDSASIRLQDVGTHLETTILLSREGQEGS